MTEEATKKSSPLKWILMGCGGCGILGIGFFALIFGVVMAATGPARDAAHQHINSVKAGNVDQAYDATSSEFKQSVSKEEFGTFVKTWGTLYGSGADLTLSNINVANNTGTLSGTSTSPAGTARVTIVVVKVGETWKVSGVNLSGDNTDPGK